MNLGLSWATSPGLAPGSANSWSRSRRSLRLRFYLSLITLDSVSLLASFVLASMFYQGRIELDSIAIPVVLLGMYLVLALNGRAYSVDILRAHSRGLARAAQAFAIAITTLMIIAFFLKASADFSRATLALGALASFVTMMLCRRLFTARARVLLGGNPYSTVLITDGDKWPEDGEFCMIIPMDADIDPDHHDPHMYDRLASMLQYADRVVVACQPARRMSWVHALKGANIRSEMVMPELAPLAPLGLASWRDLPTVVVAEGPLGTMDAFIKRSFDVAVAGTALLLISPVLLVVAVAIKLESDGPIFFVQQRIGWGNRMFRMLKFRSMRVAQSDSAGHASTQRDDARVTRVGAIIRRTSLDELPQLINVLKGDMSIVGPRPHALGSRAADKLFWEVDQRYWHRHAAKPGLTGLAQVRGYRGATMYEHDLVNRLQADLEYLTHWSIWKDLRIIVQTFRVLVHHNAF